MGRTLQPKGEINMKKYKVVCLVDDREMIVGVKPHSNIVDWDILNGYIEAENKKEAIIFAIDYLCEELINNGCIPDVDYGNETITIYEDKKLVRQYYNFKAAEYYEQED